MRTDVKLGVVVAMVVVLVSGGYYMYRNKQQQAIPIGDDVAAASPKTASDKPVASPRQPVRKQQEPRVAQRTPSPSPASAQERNTPRSEQASPGVVRSTRPNPTAKQPARQPNGSDMVTPAQRLAQRSGGEPVSERPGSTLPAGTPAQAETAPSQQVVASQDSSARETVTQPQARVPGATRPSPQLPPVPVRTADATSEQSRSVPLTATRDASAAVERHRVQPGDTLAALAIQYYGSERYTQFLIDANGQLANPNRLKIGDVINIPPAPRRATEVERTSAPGSATSGPASGQPSGRRTYTVQSGDSFYAIARDQLGDAERWKELFELNRQLVGGEPTALRVGQVLVLPN